MVELTGSNLISGEWSARGERHFTSIDPRTGGEGEVEFVETTPEEIHAAVTAAASAFDELRQAPNGNIAGFLDAIADVIMGLGDQLIEVCDRETALGRARLEYERERTCNQLGMFADAVREGSHVQAIIETGDPKREPRPKPDLRRMLVPIGPVAVFGASNFPLAFGACGGDTASALAARCPVIAKGHHSHPATSELMTRAVLEAIERSGLPEGTFSLLQGESVGVARALVMEPGLEAVAFTGSLRAGRAIHDLATSRPRPIPVFAEMGSTNPVFVLSSALEDIEGLANQIVGSVTRGSGQFCTKPGLIVVMDGGPSERLMSLVAELMDGTPCAPLLNKKVRDELKESVRRTAGHGSVRVLTSAGAGNEPAACNTVMATDARSYMASGELQGEHFGPVTIFVTCTGRGEMMEVAKGLGGQLTASIYAGGEEMTLVKELLDALSRKAGRLILNGMPTGVEVCSATQHGGPYPATTAQHTTSVGTMAIARFLRPVAFQDVPEAGLPDALKSKNPLGIMRLVDGAYTREPMA